MKIALAKFDPQAWVDDIKCLALAADQEADPDVQLQLRAQAFRKISVLLRERLAGMPKQAELDLFNLALIEQGLTIMSPAILIAGGAAAVWAFQTLKDLIASERMKQQKSMESTQISYDVVYPYWEQTEGPGGHIS